MGAQDGTVLGDTDLYRGHRATQRTGGIGARASAIELARRIQEFVTTASEMYWVYGGYVVLSIIALGLLSIFNAAALASGSGLARSVCAYIAVFWGIRLSLQAVLDVKPFLLTWWLKAGYATLTVFFLYFTSIFAWAALV